jgi:hypothetical protein
VVQNESTSDQLRLDARKLLEAALELMDYASLLISKSVEIDNHIARIERRKQVRKK